MAPPEPAADPLAPDCTEDAIESAGWGVRHVRERSSHRDGLLEHSFERRAPCRNRTTRGAAAVLRLDRSGGKPTPQRGIRIQPLDETRGFFDITDIEGQRVLAVAEYPLHAASEKP